MKADDFKTYLSGAEIMALYSREIVIRRQNLVRMLPFDRNR